MEGAFPEVQGIKPEYRVRILQDYLDVVVLRDLVERHNISNTVPLRYMIRHLLNAPGSPFSINKFYNDLKSPAIRCAKNTLHEYLDYISGNFSISSGNDQKMLNKEGEVCYEHDT